MRLQCLMMFISLLLLVSIASAKPATVSGRQGMVVTEQRLASQIGAEILDKGGNAIDAAVAVGYALAVVTPCCGNIGGGGFMLIHLATHQQDIFINFREKAGHLASKNMYREQHSADQSLRGYLAVAVPGTVLGLDTALQKYGTMSRESVMRPAIDLAKKGFVVTSYQAKLFAKFAADFQKYTNIQKIFFKNDQPLQAGDRLKQIDLANTLTFIAKNGAQAFYAGPIAREIVDASHKHGGILTLSDFANYRIQITKPLQCRYRGYTLLTSPPPGSGTTLCEILNILQNIPLQQLGYRSQASVQDIVEAMGFGFNDRNRKLGDPDFIQNPVNHLLSKSYTMSLSKKILSHDQKHSSQQANPTKEHSTTTHYSIIDKEGNAVSVTYTLNGSFGAGVIAGNTGFFLNNEMDDFAASSTKPNQFGLIQQGDANAIQPGKRPLSSMSPTIVLKNNHLWLILGSPGGPRIITSVLLTLLNLIDYHFNLQQAIDAPRFHFQGTPKSIFVEPNALSDKVTSKLQKEGYSIIPSEAWGAVAAILIKPNGVLIGAMDTRRPDGAAIVAP